MITGASPGTHRIKARTDTLHIETLFDTLSEAGMKSAAAGWADSTVGILLSPLAACREIACSDTDEELLQKALKTVDGHRPEFLITQFLGIDHTGHSHGLEGTGMKEAVSEADRRLEILLGRLAEEKYGVLVMADHGAHQKGAAAVHGEDCEEDLIVPLVWV